MEWAVGRGLGAAGAASNSTQSTSGIEIGEYFVEPKE
jgi:hypothetical protein